MDKKAMAFEELSRIILALLVLVVVIAVFYILFKPNIDAFLGIQTETDQGTDNVIDDLRDIFGKEEEEVEGIQPGKNIIERCEDIEQKGRNNF